MRALIARHYLGRTTYYTYTCASTSEIWSGIVTPDATSDRSPRQPQHTNPTLHRPLRSLSAIFIIIVLRIRQPCHQQTPVGTVEHHGEDGGDDGTDSDGANGLVCQLEASEEEEDEEQEAKQATISKRPDGDDEPGTGLWSSLQYATYMTGMHSMVREKHRVQSILAGELAKAYAEFEDATEEPTVTVDVRNQLAATAIRHVVARKCVCVLRGVSVFGASSTLYCHHLWQMKPEEPVCVIPSLLGDLNSYNSTALCKTKPSFTQQL